MFLSDEFGNSRRTAARDMSGTRITHLLTMARGMPDAVPERLISALRAMGITVEAMAERGLGLALGEEVPGFLQRDPFCLAEIGPEERAAACPDAADPAPPEAEPALPPARAAEEGPATGPADALPPPLLLVPADVPEPAPAAEGYAPAAGSAEAGVAEAPAEPEEEPAAEAADAPLPEDKADRILDRLDLIEFLVSEQGGAAAEEGRGTVENRLARIEAALGQLQDDGTVLTEEVARIEAACRRVEEAVAALAARPAPALNLTTQQRSFAAFGTAMATLQNRIAALADRFEAGQTRFLADPDGRLTADGAQAPAAARDLEVEALLAVVAALSDQLAAARQGPEQGPAPDALRLTQERIVSMLTQLHEMPDVRMQAAREEFLRDVRMIIAKLLAENHRTAIA